MKSFFSTKYLLAILSGLMLTASFPPGKFGWIIWFSLIPLLLALQNESPSSAFKLGFIAGLSHYLTLIYWINLVLSQYGNLNIILCIVPFILLCAYLSLYPAIFSLLVIKFTKNQYFNFLFMASFWVCLEYIRGKALTGFPWCLLGYSQFSHLNLIKISDICGVYGVSFLIILGNGLIYRTIFGPHRIFQKVFWGEVLFIGLIVGAVVSYSYFNYPTAEINNSPKNTFKASIIQGNIEQAVKWNPSYQNKTVEIYERLTKTSHTFQPHLIVWPETAVPFFFQEPSDLSFKVVSIGRRAGADLVFGSPAYKRYGSRVKYFNRAYALTQNEDEVLYYDKLHLVPFGEYVPLKKFLPFVKRLAPAAGDFASGENTEPLPLSKFTAGISICFEAIFPEISRAQSKNGAEILVNLTNDAWFGMSSAPYQHFSMAVFRAVENRRPLIRAANTGLSAFIDPTGKILSQTDLFSRETLNGSFELSHHSLSFYTRYGDVFVFLLFILSCAKIVFYLKRKKATAESGAVPRK